jgi:hypothetical protein
MIGAVVKPVRVGIDGRKVLPLLASNPRVFGIGIDDLDCEGGDADIEPLRIVTLEDVELVGD